MRHFCDFPLKRLNGAKGPGSDDAILLQRRRQAQLMAVHIQKDLHRFDIAALIASVLTD